MEQPAGPYIIDVDSDRETSSQQLAIDPLQKNLDMVTQHGLLTPVGADPVKIRTGLYVLMQPCFSGP
jgi:hypothetical protein